MRVYLAAENCMTEARSCTKERVDNKQDHVTCTVIAQRCWDC